MTKHTSYRGVQVDMAALARENEHSIAVGNAGVNARGDKIRGSTIAKTSEQIARENHRNQSTTIINASLKGPVPQLEDTEIQKSSVKPTVKKVIEKELPSGDIIIENE